MNIFQRRLVGVAMVELAAQWRTRVGLGVMIALAFFPMTDVAFAAGGVRLV